MEEVREENRRNTKLLDQQEEGGASRKVNTNFLSISYVPAPIHELLLLVASSLMFTDEEVSKTKPNKPTSLHPHSRVLLPLSFHARFPLLINALSLLSDKLIHKTLFRPNCLSEAFHKDLSKDDTAFN